MVKMTDQLGMSKATGLPEMKGSSKFRGMASSEPDKDGNIRIVVAWSGVNGYQPLAPPGSPVSGEIKGLFYLNVDKNGTGPKLESGW